MAKKQSNSYWVVREEAPGKPIIGVHFEEEFNDVDEVIEGKYRRHPVHFTVDKIAGNKLTRRMKEVLANADEEHGDEGEFEA